MTRLQASTRLVATKNRLVCGKLMAQQILTRFDPDKKFAVLRQKIGSCAASLNRSIVSKRVRCESLSLTNDVISSANITYFISQPSTTIPLFWSLLRMDNANNSSTIMRRDGESGSPWRTPRLRLKEGVEKPLLITQLDIFFSNSLIIHEVLNQSGYANLVRCVWFETPMKHWTEAFPQ